MVFQQPKEFLRKTSQDTADPVSPTHCPLPARSPQLITRLPASALLPSDSSVPVVVESGMHTPCHERSPHFGTSATRPAHMFCPALSTMQVRPSSLSQILPYGRCTSTSPVLSPFWVDPHMVRTPLFSSHGISGPRDRFTLHCGVPRAFLSPPVQAPKASSSFS